MIDDIRAMTFYVRTVELGSFRACAENFNLSPSVISQQIRQLEEKYGTALLYRSTRKLSQTDAGKKFYAHAKQMVEGAENALSVLSQNDQAPMGKLTITLPASLIKSPLTHKIADFAKHHPKIELDLRYDDRRQDLIENGIDLAFRVGKMEDSTLRSIRLSQIERRLVCHRYYYARKETPLVPYDLKDWDWLKMRMMPPYRRLINQNGQIEDIYFKAQIEVDNTNAMYELARQGMGLCSPPDFMVEDDIKSGLMVEILPEWRVAPLDVYAVWPHNVARNHLTSLFIDQFKA